MAWVHTLTFPVVLFYQLTLGYNDVDFVALNEAEQRLSIYQGTVFHYWNTNEEKTNGKLFLTAGIDLLTLVASVFVVLTIPLQYLMMGTRILVLMPLRAFFYKISNAEEYLPETEVEEELEEE